MFIIIQMNVSMNWCMRKRNKQIRNGFKLRANEYSNCGVKERHQNATANYSSAIFLNARTHSHLNWVSHSNIRIESMNNEFGFKTALTIW